MTTPAQGIQPLKQPIATPPSIAPAAPPPAPAAASQPAEKGWTLQGGLDTIANGVNAVSEFGKKVVPQTLQGGLDTIANGVNAVGEFGKKVVPQMQQAGFMSSVMPALRLAAPQILHALMPMGGVLRSGGLPAIAGMAGMVQGKNTLAPLFTNTSPQEFGQQAAAASQTPGN